MALNQWIGIGRLTKDVEVRHTQSGIPVASFTIAVDRPYSKSGEKVTDFLTIVAWDKKATFVSQYFRKGDPIQVVGCIETRKYQDRDGNDRVAVEVNAEKVSFVEGYKRAEQQNRGRAEYEEIEDEDEDLPF